MAGTDKILKANLFKSFGEFQTPMGVELMKVRSYFYYFTFRYTPVLG